MVQRAIVYKWPAWFHTKEREVQQNPKTITLAANS